jgi:hypothetical protein
MQDKIQDYMGGTCRTQGKRGVKTGFLCEKETERNNWKELGIK